MDMRQHGIVALALVMALVSGCGKKEEAPAPVAEPAAPVTEPAKRSAPDFGGVTKVSREVEAVGSTQELAIVAALQQAVAQVNGTQVASQLQSLRTGLDVTVDGRQELSVRSEAFAQKLIAASQGTVTGYEVLSQEEIDKVDEEAVAKVKASDGGYSYSASASSSASGTVNARADASANIGADGARASSSYSGSASYSDKANVDVKRGATSYESDSTYKKMRSYWKVRLRVDVAQYRAPEERGKPKIVVAMPRANSGSYTVGDSRVPAPEVASAIRGRLSDILTQTKRFIVLDREFSSEMQAEIDHINSGNVRVQDFARLKQQLATDLILIPSIERFEYAKSVKQLRMSDRQLVSYAGGGRITLRLLNAATGEVVMSDSFDHKLASADPSTMPRVIDGNSMAAQMMDALSGQIGSAIVTEIFPVSVVALNGDQVVLSQGGESLQAGQRWEAVYLGEELKDPQTGNSLGRHEMPFGTIRVDRVSSQTSYGTVEEGAGALGARPFVPGSIELRKRMAEVTTARAPEQVEPAAAPVGEKPSRPVRPAKADPDIDRESPQAPAAGGPKDDRW